MVTSQSPRRWKASGPLQEGDPVSMGEELAARTPRPRPHIKWRGVPPREQEMTEEQGACSPCNPSSPELPEREQERPHQARIITQQEQRMHKEGRTETAPKGHADGRTANSYAHGALKDQPVFQGHETYKAS